MKEKLNYKDKNALKGGIQVRITIPFDISKAGFWFMNTKKDIGYVNMNKKYNNIIFINEII